MIKFINTYISSLISFLIGIFLAIFIITTTSIGVETYNRYYIRADDIFVSNVLVPDFKVGENPLVVYERTIKKDFVGAFDVEVRSVDTGVTVCRGSEDNIFYDTDDKLNPSNVTLDWYIGNNCSDKLFPGKYTLKTVYTIKAENIPEKYLKTLSNIFQVNL